jgi:hypothetical protein
MADSDDIRSSPAMRRRYALVIATEVAVVAALWAMKQIFG